MKKILVTGGTGFIGGYLLKRLKQSHEVWAIARQIPHNEHELSHVHWIEHDLTQPLDLSKLPTQVDTVIHLAQSKNYKQFPEKSDDIFDINIRSTFQLLEYTRQVGARSFIYASSGGVYGYSYERFVETDPVSPINFYLSSKYCSELLVANYQPFFNTVVLRLFFVYGPGQRGMLIPNLYQRVLNDQTITLEGSPGLRINPMYVEDAVTAFERAMDHEVSALFNVAGDELVNLTDLVQLMGRLAGKHPTILHQEAKISGDLIGHNAWMKDAFQMWDFVPLEVGLEHLKTDLLSQ